jgi:phosphodiesterase/alkaline phosphatase D-like protein
MSGMRNILNWIILLVLVISCSRPEDAGPPSITITHDPLLGRLESNAIGIWARTSRPADFRVKYGTSPGDLNHTSKKVPTLAAADQTGWVRLEGLTADTRYYYALECGGREYPGGSFQTLPDNQIYRDDQLNPDGLFNFSFEFACGNNQDVGSGAGPTLPAFKTLNEKFTGDIYFSIQNGDWLYEDFRDFSVEDWCRQNGTEVSGIPPVLRTMPNITGVWQNYKGYLERGDNLAEFHRYVPCFYSFDDHELLNDVIGTAEKGYVNRRAVIRDIATQAWYDYLGWSNPVEFTQGIVSGKAEFRSGDRILVDTEADFNHLDSEQMTNLHVHWGTQDAAVNQRSLDSMPGNPNAGVYDIVRILDNNRLEIDPPARSDGKAAYSIGRRSYFRQTIGNCDFLYVDTRSTRHIHDHLNRSNPNKSMLGKVQLDWLLAGLNSSEADFIFIVSSVNFMIPHLSGGVDIVQFKDDAWTAFLHEREMVINACDEKGSPVFILTGDLHNSFAIRITDNVWEFASGPRNSRNHKYTDEGSRPATGPFESFDRDCDIRWSTWYLDDASYPELIHPHFCIVSINNVFNSPKKAGKTRYIAFERPQVIFRYYDGLTGKPAYAESIVASR